MDVVSVAVVSSRTEADLIAGLLRSHGLKVDVTANDAGGQDPNGRAAARHQPDHRSAARHFAAAGALSHQRSRVLQHLPDRSNLGGAPLDLGLAQVV